MWTITNQKIGNGYQELRVAAMVKEMTIYNTSETSGGFAQAFKTQLVSIPRSNNFSAENMYMAESVERNENTPEQVEIWKLKANGDKNYLMYTLTFKK